MSQRWATLGVVLLLVTAGCTAIVSGPQSTPSPVPPADDSLRVTVTSVVDGDTFDVEYPNGTTERIRLLGIDTPEVHVATDPEEWEGVPVSDSSRQCLRQAGHNASRFASDQLSGADVLLQFDPEAERRGSFGRLLVYVVDDGENFNHRLVATGYARLYESPFALYDRFAAAESQARDAHRGAWQCQHVERPTTPVPDSNGISIGPIQPDAPGDEYDNLDEEYVSIENEGEMSVDISGWRISDGDGHTYTVPAGTTLESGDRLTLFTGSGSGSALKRYWGLDAPVWNNDGDTITVSNADGDTVLEGSY